MSYAKILGVRLTKPPNVEVFYFPCLVSSVNQGRTVLAQNLQLKVFSSLVAETWLTLFDL